MGGSARSPKPTSLLCVTLNPHLPWKPTRRVWTQAKRMGMEVAVSLDERSSPEALSLSRELADVLIVRRHDFAEGGLNDLLAASSRSWAFVVSDDEEPSAALWKIASRPTLPVAYRVLMLCPITRTTHYERG